jgi:hypothetical protein
MLVELEEVVLSVKERYLKFYLIAIFYSILFFPHVRLVRYPLGIDTKSR